MTSSVSWRSATWAVISSRKTDMEIVKYLCEFFFGNFWHYLGLIVMLETIFGGIGTQIYVKLRENTKKD